MSNFIGSPKMWDGIMGGRVKFVTATLLPVVYVVGAANSCYSRTHIHTATHENIPMVTAIDESPPDTDRLQVSSHINKRSMLLLLSWRLTRLQLNTYLHFDPLPPFLSLSERFIAAQLFLLKLCCCGSAFPKIVTADYSL